MGWDKAASEISWHLFAVAMIAASGACLLFLYPPLIRAVDDHKRVSRWEDSVAGHHCKALAVRLNNGGSVDAAMDDAVLRMYCNTNVWMEDK